MTQISVFLVDRAFGGPEEGGWWYTRGDLVRTGEGRHGSAEHSTLFGPLRDVMAKS